MGMDIEVDGDSTARGFIGISNVDDEDVSPLPSPQLTSETETGYRFAERRDSQILSAEFLKGNGLKSPKRRAKVRGVKVNNSKKAMMETAKHVKELQFLSQKLSSDVATKSQSIENLSTANTVLLEQMQRMKSEMERLQSQKQRHDEEKKARAMEVRARGKYKAVSTTDV